MTLLQFAERLPDRQVADAVRRRIDWKYLLGLELTDPGFDASVLTEFRARLVDHEAASRQFDRLLEQFQSAGLLKAGGRQRTDSTPVLGAIRAINRLALVGETMRASLNALAVVEPPWLLGVSALEWFERYGPRFEHYRLPGSKATQEALTEQIGADGEQLLQAIYHVDAPGYLTNIPAVEVLRQVWIQNYLPQAASG